MITIINFGMGNLGSIANMLKKIGVEAKITASIDDINKAKKIILPGVGAFDEAMKRLKNANLIETLSSKALEEKVPILGICLGMQLLTESSEEGTLPGLGWIPAKTIRFRFNGEVNHPVPHMGWNTVCPNKKSLLTDGLTHESRFYFVHSYYVKVEHDSNSLLKTFYGFDFDSAINKDNVYGVQFHPEKSHKFGMKLLTNFTQL